MSSNVSASSEMIPFTPRLDIEQASVGDGIGPFVEIVRNLSSVVKSQQVRMGELEHENGELKLQYHLNGERLESKLFELTQQIGSMQQLIQELKGCNKNLEMKLTTSEEMCEKSREEANRVHSLLGHSSFVLQEKEMQIQSLSSQNMQLKNENQSLNQVVLGKNHEIEQEKIKFEAFRQKHEEFVSLVWEEQGRMSHKYHTSFSGKLEAFNVWFGHLVNGRK